jgi:ssDNA-binding Zn-finger/Zn-ribbon topoisomerase 1
MHVWVIETKEKGNWTPCADAKLSRKDAVREKSFYWAHNYPKGKFRVTKYVPAAAAKP